METEKEKTHKTKCSYETCYYDREKLEYCKVVDKSVMTMFVLPVINVEQGRTVM